MESMVDVGYGKSSLPNWVAGEPVTTWWWSGLNLRGKEQLPVATYRCRPCGYLESYA